MPKNVCNITYVTPAPNTMNKLLSKACSYRRCREWTVSILTPKSTEIGQETLLNILQVMLDDTLLMTALNN